MAGRVLRNFLIGIGYDTRQMQEGERRVMSSLEGIKSGTLGISAAIVGAFGAAGASVAATARSVDQLALSTQNLRTSQNAVYNYGNAVRLMGGEASEAVEALKRFEEIQNDLAVKGEAGPIRELAMAGIDVSTLYNTKTGEEFAQELSKMLPNLNEGQRAVAQQALGVSDASFRLFSGGIDRMNEALQNAQSFTGNIDGLVDNSRRLQQSTGEFSLLIEGIRNELAEKFLPSIIGASDSVNLFIKTFRTQISEGIGYAAENPLATTAIGGSAAASVLGAGASKLGLKTLGGGLSRAGTLGLAVSSGAVLSDVANKGLNEYLPGYGEAASWFDKKIMDITGLERIPSPMEVLFGSRSAEDSASTPKESPEEMRQANAEALAGALSRAPVQVENQVVVNASIDGQAIDARIIEVSERQNYQAMQDLQSTTER